MTDDVVEVKVRSGTGKELSHEPVKCVLSVNRWLKSSSAEAFWFLFSRICFVLRIYLVRSLLARRNSPQTCNSSHVDPAWDRSFGRMVRKVVSTQPGNAGTWLTRKIAMNVRRFSKYNTIFVYFKGQVMNWETLRGWKRRIFSMYFVRFQKWEAGVNLWSRPLGPQLKT